MASSTIQRQSIVSTIITFAGFGFGALNLLVLQKWLLTPAQWGLTRVVTEAAVLMAIFSTFGTPNVVAKFLPFYKHYLPAKKNDLPFITLVVYLAGLVFTFLLMVALKPQITGLYSAKSPLFGQYYYALLLFTAFQSLFFYMEIHALFAGKIILANVLKEFVFRVLTTALLLLMAVGAVSFDGFMKLFACIYLPAGVILVVAVRRAGAFTICTRISSVTRRLKWKMASLGSFIFFTSLSSMAFTVCSTLFLAGMGSLSHAGIWAVADYFSTILEVPYRSLQSSSTPLVSEYWRAKNKVGLLSIYKKSCINLLVAGMGFGGLILVNLNNIYRYFGPDYSIVLVPLVILVISRWINLGTGLNALIIQLSTHWRFDFFSTLIYSLIGIPLNFFLIKKYDMTGAAVANLTAMLLYNSVRFTFIWKKFGLQPLGWKNIGLLFFGSALIALVYAIPSLENLYIDGIFRSILFALLFGTLVIKGKFSDELIQMWVKWSNKIPFISARN